ncbi:unnamed protein product, partial [Nesidiocoris tenuis]
MQEDEIWCSVMTDMVAWELRWIQASTDRLRQDRPPLRGRNPFLSLRPSLKRLTGVAPASQTRTNPPVYDIVVSIDLGTTYSGYAYAFARNPSDKQIHMMRQSEATPDCSEALLIALEPEAASICCRHLHYDQIHVESVLNSRRMDDVISYLFLVGGFAESQILQEAIRDHFSGVVHIIIPQAVSLSVLKGGVLYGLNPSVVASRRVTHTYGLGVVKPFLNGIHPIEKLVIRGGQRWCVDVLERLIESGQPVSVGQIVSKKYAPASNSQTEIVLQVYATVSKSAQ